MAWILVIRGLDILILGPPPQSGILCLREPVENVVGMLREVREPRSRDEK